MTVPSSSGIDPVRTRLRHTVATIERDLSVVTDLLPPDGAGATSVEALRASWADLVTQLNLGTEPEVRGCPRCGGTVMRAARLCGNCWMKLTPLPAGAAG